MSDEKLVKFNAFRQLCLRNSEDALRAAEILIDSKVDHIVYHLSILALEEIGKIFMFWLQINRKEKWDKDNINIAMDDHVKKIFYAIWGPSIGTELITKEQLANNQFMASLLHQKRLDYLYGDITDVIESSLKLEEKEVNSIINFTKSRLSLAKMEGEVKEDYEPSADMSWFEQFLEMPGKRDYAFGKEAQDKLIETGDVNRWVAWLKEEFENEQANFFELAQKELNKPPVSNNEKIEPKWEITFTIITPSHSIRQNILTAFNKTDRPIKLFKGKDNHTLIIKVLRGNNVHVNDLWNDGWITCKLFVAALNIAAHGIFYWNIVTDIDKFYDQIKDLENGKNLTVRLDTRLTFNWREKRMYLNEQNLELAFLVYEHLITIRNPGDAKPLREYLTGLGMLAKNDIHLRLEPSALEKFYCAFCEAIALHEKPKSDIDIAELGFHQIDSMLKDRVFFDETASIAKKLKEHNVLPGPITLTHVIAMKRYCEIYFLTVAVRKHYKNNSLKIVPMSGDNAN